MTPYSLFFLTLLSVGTVRPQFNYCPQVNTTEGPLRWSRELGNMDYACRGTSKSLYCCAAGFDRLTWFQKSKHTGVWEPFPPRGWLNRESGYRLLDRNVTLLIMSVWDADDALYRCVAEGGARGENITHELKLNAVLCPGILDPPAVTFPQRNVSTNDYRITKEALPGENATLFCEAFFGRDNASSAPNVIRWLTNVTVIGDDDQTTWLTVEDIGPRFSTLLETRYSSMILGAHLTISDVQIEDYTRVFRCQMANGVDPQPSVLARLVRAPSKPSGQVYWTKRRIVIVSCCTAIPLILIITLAVIAARYSVEIRLLWKDRLGNKGGDDKEHDAFIYVSQKADRERKFVHNTLWPKLEKELGYSVIIEARDFLPGESIPTLLDNAVSSSRCFIIVLSKAMLDEPYFDFIFHVAVKEHRRIIFILFEDIQDSEWEAYKKMNSDRELVRKALKVLKRLRWHYCDELGDDLDNLSQRNPTKNEKFWKRLRLYLPPHKIHQKLSPSSRNDRLSSSSAHRPLISSTNSQACTLSSAPEDNENMDDSVFLQHDIGGDVEIQAEVHPRFTQKQRNLSSHEIINMDNYNEQDNEGNPNQSIFEVKGQGQGEGQKNTKCQCDESKQGDALPMNNSAAYDMPIVKKHLMHSTDSGYAKSLSPTT